MWASEKVAGVAVDTNSELMQTAVSILFVGYLLMQIPSNLFLNKLGKPAIYLPVCVRTYSSVRWHGFA